MHHYMPERLLHTEEMTRAEVIRVKANVASFREWAEEQTTVIHSLITQLGEAVRRVEAPAAAAERVRCTRELEKLYAEYPESDKEERRAIAQAIFRLRSLP
jgi:hypothetical protein